MDLETRVSELERWRAREEGGQETANVRQRWMDEKFKELAAQGEAAKVSLNARIDKIDGHISKLVWLIIAAIISAALSFLLRGGPGGA